MKAASAHASAAAPSRRERERAFRNRLILEAAEEVFTAKGFDAASVEEIAAQAEVAIATLYKLFGSKEAIFTALVEHRQEHFLVEVESFVRQGADPQERLRRVVEAVFRYFEEHKDTFRIYLSATHGFPWRMRSSFGERAFVRYQTFLAFVALLLQDGMRDKSWPVDDATRLAVAVMGTLNGLLTQRHTRKAERDLDDELQHALVLIRRLVGCSASSPRRRATRRS